MKNGLLHSRKAVGCSGIIVFLILKVDGETYNASLFLNPFCGV